MKTRKKNYAGNVRKVFIKLTEKDLILIKGGEGAPIQKDNVIY